MGNQMEDCKCPFCFKKFSPQKAAFKSMTVYTEQDFLAGMGEDELEQKKRYAKAPDAVYQDFWRKYPESEPENEYRDYPVIDNLSDQYVHGTQETDSSGFINRVTDEFGMVSKVRICPYCHNVLPFEFGKYPVKYISMVGITSSGKTVYLSQLLHQIEGFFVKAGLTVVGTYDEVELFLENYKILKQMPLPRGNAADGLMPPLALNVKSNDSQQIYTLVFYDIAGENCVRPDQMEKYGPFIQNSDGIILMIDPEQFLGNSGHEDIREREIHSPDKVIAAMWNAFVTSENEKGKSGIPLAVTLSKSDTQTGALDYRSSLFSNISYQNYEDHKIPLKDFAATDMEVRRLLTQLSRNKTEILCNKLNECFPAHSFFAVSALNAEPKEQKGDAAGDCYMLDEDPETIRVEEPVFWILYKLGILQVKEAEKKKRRAAVTQIAGILNACQISDGKGGTRMKLYQAGYYRLGGRASGSGWKIVAPSAGMSEIAKAGFKGIAAKLVDLKQSIQMPQRAMGIFRHDRFIYLIHVHYAASGDDSRGVAYVHGYCFSLAEYFELLLQPELLFGAQLENFDLEYDPALSAYPAVEGLSCRNMNERWLLDKYHISSESYKHLLLGSICVLEGLGGPLCIKYTFAPGQELEVYQDLMYLIMKGLPYHLRQKLLSFSWQGVQSMVFLSDTVQGDCYVDLDTEAFGSDDARLAAYQFTRLYEAELFYKNKDAREQIFGNIARFIQEVFTEPLKDAGCMQIEAAFQKLIKKNEDGIDAELSVGLLQDFLRAELHYGQETAQYIAILLETINRNDLTIADQKLVSEIEQAYETCLASVTEQMLIEQMALFYARRILAQKKDQAFTALLELKNTDAEQLYPLVCRCLEYLDLNFFTDYFWNQFLPGELTTLKKAELFLKSNGEGFSANEQFAFFKLLKNLIEDEMKRAGGFEELCVTAEAANRILNAYPQIDKAGKLWDYTCFSLWNRFEPEWFQTKSVKEYERYEVRKLAKGYEQKSCPHAEKVSRLMETLDQIRLCTDAHQLWNLFFVTKTEEEQNDRHMILRGYREEFFDRMKNGRTGGTTAQDLDQSLVLYYDPEKKQFDFVRWMSQWAQAREIVLLTSLFIEYGKASALLQEEPYKAYAAQFLDEAVKGRKHTAYSMLPESQQKALRILSDSLHGRTIRNPGTTQLFLYSLHREAMGFFGGLSLAVCGVCFWRYGSGDIFVQMIFAVVAAISMVLFAGMKAMEGWSGGERPDLGLKGMPRKALYVCFPAALAAAAGLLYDRGGFQEKALGLMAFLVVAAAMALIYGLTTKE